VHPKISVPDKARDEAVCRIARAIERTMRDLTDACPWPQRGACPLDPLDARRLTSMALWKIVQGGCNV
jgi:hypothetical protein